MSAARVTSSPSLVFMYGVLLCHSRNTCCFFSNFRHYDIAVLFLQIPIRQPIFIVSWMRTGSTLLQNLLSLDKAIKSPLLYELFSPLPPKHGPDRRLQEVRIFS